MRILAIETSCDETAVSIVDADGAFPNATYTVLGNALRSQVEAHRHYGGVFPSLGKREHAGALVPLLREVVVEAELPRTPGIELTEALTNELTELLARESGLADALITFHRKYGRLEIDRIAVTSGPGLEPALWVGINFAKALARLWHVPVIPVNHLEGHLLASVFDHEHDDQLTPVNFPAVGLIISGGHTELLLIKEWGHYEKLGQTRDDAVGEAYDKVARLLGLPYPGGPEIAARAARARRAKLSMFSELTPPMLDSGDLDLSFSGLKTAVRYAIADRALTEDETAALARDFEDAVTTALVAKTTAALAQAGARTLIVGGGVSANQHLKRALEATVLTAYPDVPVYTPGPGLATDNSLMIALAGHARAESALAPAEVGLLRAEGNKQHRRVPLGEW